MELFWLCTKACILCFLVVCPAIAFIIAGIVTVSVLIFDALRKD